MPQVLYILFGFLLGLVSTLFARWLQTKDERLKTEIEIISETLKYLFRINQSYNDLYTDKATLEYRLKGLPEKYGELEREMYERFGNEIEKDFFPELMFHSFQLKRLEDKSFWQDFEDLMNGYRELGLTILGKSDLDEIEEHNTSVKVLMKRFVEKCLSKTKV